MAACARCSRPFRAGPARPSPVGPRGRPGACAVAARQPCLAALNAYVGDALAATGSELALAMTLRHRGADLPLDADGPARAVPEAAPRLAIFVHRLGETDASWGLRADAQRPGYDARPQRDLGHTPIDVHYNNRPAHLRQRARAGGAAGGSARGLARGHREDRDRRAHDRRPGRAQRLSLRPQRGARLDERRAPRLRPALAAPRRAPGEEPQRAGLGAGRVPETRPPHLVASSLDYSTDPEITPTLRRTACDARSLHFTRPEAAPAPRGSE
jgi:hypothetical protein